jgi:hypothetical protein
MLKKWLLQYAVSIIVLLCVLSRLPQLFHTTVLLDSDECIVGLMAKHWLDGKAIPAFFYGQNYGFAFIEVAIVRVFYSFFGVNDLAVRASMLFLWTIGIVFHYKTLQNLADKTASNNNKWTAFLLTLVFVFCPAWAVWSLKARGGYLTAFSLCSMANYLLLHKNAPKNALTWAFLGVLTTVIYQAQPLWLVGLLPILGYILYQQKTKRIVLAFATGVLATIVTFIFIKTGLPNFWNPQLIAFRFSHIGSIYTNVQQTFTGSHVYEYVKPAFVVRIVAHIFAFLTFSGLIIGFIFLLKKEKVNPLFYLFGLAVFLSICYKIGINDASPRYLLPLSGWVSLFFYAFIENTSFQKVYNTALYMLLVLCGVSLYTFSKMDYEFTPKAVVLHTIQQIENQHTPYVFCKGSALQWSLIFYSNERITARYTAPTDRYPLYVKAVNKALQTAPNTTALVGFLDSGDTAKFHNAAAIDHKYYILAAPTKEQLLQEYFRF